MRKFLSVLLAVMMVLSTASFAAPSAFMPIDAAVELPAAAETAEPEADLAAAFTDSAPKGDLVFEVDFDDYAEGAAVTGGTKLVDMPGAYVNSNYEGYETWYLLLSNYGNAVIENGALKAVKTSTNKWPQIQVSAGSKNAILDGGIIYMEADMKLGLDAEQTETATLGLTGYRKMYDEAAGEWTSESSSYQCSVQTVYDIVNNQWYSLKGSYALNNDDGYNGVECIIYLTSYSASSDLQDYFYIDNLRLYHKPFEVDVTVTTETGTTGVAKVSTTEPVSFDTLAAAVELGVQYTPVGLYIGDDYYSAEDTVYFTSDTEVELVLEAVDSEYFDPDYGAMIINVGFEDYEVGTQVLDNDTLKFTEASKTPLTDKLVTAHEFTRWAVMSNTGKTYIYEDPTNPDNKVIGVQDITSTGYPVIRLDCRADYNLDHQWGWVESEAGIYTVVYDVLDVAGNVTMTERFGGLSSKYINESTGYYTEKEDIGLELEATPVLGQYRTNVAQYTPSNWSNLASSTEVSYIKIHAVKPESATYYLDNIRVYWKPLLADVTLDKNGFDVKIDNQKIKDADTSGMTVADIIDLAGVQYDSSRYNFLGLSFDAEGTGKIYGLNDTVGFAGDSILYFIMEEVELEDNPWYDENGMILFEIDFEDSRAASLFTPNTNNTNYLLSGFAKVNPNIAGSDKWALSTSGMDVVGIENGALKLQWDGSGKYPQVLIGNPDNKVENVMIGTHGTYHVHAEYMLVDAIDADLASIALTANGVVDGVHKSATGILPMGSGFYKSNGTLAAANEWLTIDGSKSTKDIDTDGIDNDDINKITTVFTYGNTSSAAGGYYLIDNIKLSWKPDKADLTVYGGSNADYETVTLTDISTSSTIDDVIGMLPVSDYGKIVGLADMNGKVLTSLSLVSDYSSVVAVWAPWVVLEGGQEFTSSTRSDWLDQVAYGAQCTMGNGGADITTALRWMYSNGWTAKGGNMFRTTKTPALGDAENGTLTSPNPYSIPAALSLNGEIRDYILTSLPAENDGEYLLIKYRYDNVPDLNALAANCQNPEGYGYTVSDDGLTITFKDRNGADQTATIKPAYDSKIYVKRPTGSYSYGGGEEFYNNQVMVEDQWYTVLLPFDSNMNAEGVSQILVQRANLFDGQVVEYDFVRFVKTGEAEDVVLPNLGGAVKIKAPTTVETAEARISDDQYGNGLRFKASVVKKTAEVTEDLGWIVTTQAYCRANIGAEEDLTLAAETDVNDPKVKVAYQIQGGEAKANFYGGTDEEPVFSAVLYGIPLEHMYDLIVVRPFAKSGTTEKYGDPIVTSLFDAAIAPYIILAEDYAYVSDLALMNDTLEDAFDYGDIAYADAYYELSDAHKAYVEEMIAADFELGLNM